MSITESEIISDSDDVVGKTVSPYRRALEVAALVLAVAALLLVFSAAAQTYTAVKVQGGEPTANQIIRFLNSQILQPLIPLLALLAIVVAAIIRSFWSGEQRSHDRTITAATIALITALVVVVASLYEIIATLVEGSSQLGETPEAKFTSIITALGPLALAVGTLIGGVLFARSRDDLEDDLDESSDESDGAGDNDSDDAVSLDKADADAAALEAEAGTDTHYKA